MRVKNTTSTATMLATTLGIDFNVDPFNLEKPVCGSDPWEANNAVPDLILKEKHKLKEVLTICDKITVLRKGKVVGTVNAKETNQK